MNLDMNMLHSSNKKPEAKANFAQELAVKIVKVQNAIV
jgi:hypothetical protein